MSALPEMVPTTAEARSAQRLADLDRRLTSLENGHALIQIGNGAPTADPTTLRAGTPYIDYFNKRLYAVVGDPAVPAGNTWRYTILV